MEQTTNDGRVERLGPFADGSYRFIIGGYELPYVRGWPSEERETEWRISHLTRPFGITVSQEDMDQWLWFLGNAMAAAAGYSCLGAGSVPLNPYRSQAHMIETVSLRKI